MNTEQLRKEFEAKLYPYYERKTVYPCQQEKFFEYYKDSNRYRYSDVQESWELYQTAAQSRDELIEKLVKLIGVSKQVHQIANDWHAPICYDVEVPEELESLKEPDSDEPDWIFIHHLIKHLEQVIAEARAQGYGE